MWERVELETLVFADNGLTAVSDELGRLKRLRMLRHLDLRGNPLASLPESIAELPALDKLDLRWVPTLPLPAWVPRLEARGVLVYR